MLEDRTRWIVDDELCQNKHTYIYWLVYNLFITAIVALIVSLLPEGPGKKFVAGATIVMMVISFTGQVMSLLVLVLTSLYSIVCLLMLLYGRLSGTDQSWAALGLLGSIFALAIQLPLMLFLFVLQVRSNTDFQRGKRNE